MDLRANRDSPQCAGVGDGPILPELGTVAISSGSPADGDCPHFRGPATLADRAQWGQSRLAIDCARLVTVPNAPALEIVPSCRNWGLSPLAQDGALMVTVPISGDRSGVS